MRVWFLLRSLLLSKDLREHITFMRFVIGPEEDCLLAKVFVHTKKGYHVNVKVRL